MNYLAHVYLARHADEAMLGALLGDFVFGVAALDDWPPVVRADIVLHRKIDRFTDDHPAVLALRERFPDGRRRYAGIALDVFFDHCLARDWSRWCDEDLDVFTARFYRVLLAALPQLPPRLQQIAPSIAAHDWLGSYRHRANVDRAVTRIATRLSRNGDKLVACLDDLRRHEAAVAAAFAAFFPDLLVFVAGQRKGILAADERG
jgi:acyl carrier protein phosphodiesterase